MWHFSTGKWKTDSEIRCWPRHSFTLKAPWEPPVFRSSLQHDYIWISGGPPSLCNFRTTVLKMFWGHESGNGTLSGGISDAQWKTQCLSSELLEDVRAAEGSGCNARTQRKQLLAAADVITSARSRSRNVGSDVECGNADGKDGSKLFSSCPPQRLEVAQKML